MGFTDSRRGPSLPMRWGHRPLAFIAVVAPLIFAAFSWTPPATAGTGLQATLPTGAKMKSGLQVNVDTTWVDANGYRSVQLELIPMPGPAPADRSIRVEFKPYSWRGGYGWCGVTDFIEIPQGATRVQTTLAVPQREQWSTFHLDFYEEGEHLEDLTYRGAMGFTGNYGWTETAPAMLFIDRDAPPRAQRQQRIVELRQIGAQGQTYTLPDVRALAEIYPPPDMTRSGYNPTERPSDLDLLDSLSGWSKLEILPASDLPTRWIEYTGFDLLFLSLDDLRAMTGQNPEQWQAVRDLVATGPTLCVYGAGEEFSRLHELEELLGMAPLDVSGQAARYRGWTIPAVGDYTRPLVASFNVYSYGRVPPAADSQADAVAPDAVALAPNETAQGEAPARPNFVWRPLALGRVVAIAAEDPFPGSPQEWRWVLNTVDDDNWMWHRRHGLSLNRRNFDYWSFLIPGVGLAPVNSFLVLISLFVVVIGPLNYWFLVRQGRLYLLLLTVPAGALAITLSLFGYALITDGLGVKARVRSYTEIDQQRGRSVSWSRQSYYAAMTPSRGLEYPETAAAYPIVVEPHERPNFYDNKHRIDWEYGQTLAKGYLASRITSQMMVVQARETKAGVEINERASGPPQAVNRLGVPLEYFVLRDSQGAFFAAENVADGQTATLAPTSWPDAAARLEKALSDARPANPEGYNPREHNEALDFGSSRYYRWGGDVDGGLSDPNVNSSILERALRRLTSSDPDALAPRSYAALTPFSPEVPLGVERVQQMQSVHVVVGRW